VQIPATLEPLVERLAQNNHDVWGRERLAAKWTYGPTRDDELRTHPDLVAYRKLTDQEKRLDRATVAETIKAILKLGFQILPAIRNGTARGPRSGAPPGERRQA
jgi:hypothetical protein